MPSGRPSRDLKAATRCSRRGGDRRLGGGGKRTPPAKPKSESKSVEVPMQRRFEFMDLIVAVGLCATIVASGLLLMAANGMQIRSVGRGAVGQPTDNLTGIDLLQPVLGHAIVDHVLLERRHAKDAAAAITHLDALIFERNQWHHFPYSYLRSEERRVGK